MNVEFDHIMDDGAQVTVHATIEPGYPASNNPPEPGALPEVYEMTVTNYDGSVMDVDALGVRDELEEAALLVAAER